MTFPLFDPNIYATAYIALQQACPHINVISEAVDALKAIGGHLRDQINPDPSLVTDTVSRLYAYRDYLRDRFPL